MSIFNREHNVLFIHVPKTAGTSMERCFFLGGGGHKTIRDFPEAQDAFRFAFVRNPWDRFISAYCCQTNVDDPNDLGAFDWFVRNRCSPNQYPVRGLYWKHFIPQWHFLLDVYGRIGVDFVGHFESLEKDWRHVCRRVGVTAKLPHERKVDHRPYKHYYTPESWDIIGRLYRRDVKLFGYRHCIAAPDEACQDLLGVKMPDIPAWS